MSCKTCVIDGVSYFPHYGVAPHTCYYKKPGAVIGESTLLPESEWPYNFRADPEDPGCGIYYCPECKAGLPPIETEGSTPSVSIPLQITSN